MLLNINDTTNELPNNQSGFRLSQVSSLLYKRAQVETVCIFLDHVYFVRCFDSLVMLDAVITVDHAVNFDLSEDLLQVVLFKSCRVKDFAGVDLFTSINCGANSLLTFLVFIICL